MKNKYLILLIILLAGFLRFRNLGDYGLWIDECLYVGYVEDGATQEYVPQLLGYIFGTSTDFQTRLPFAICSTLTALAIYYVLEDKKSALALAFVFATLPLFVWWGHLARPYAIAGLFMVLSWRSPYWMLLAVFTTPISLLGLNPYNLKKEWKLYLILILLTLVLYFIRSDYGRGHWTVQNILVSTRWWYLPILAGLLHCGRLCGYLAKFGTEKELR
jgi:hypothetical protein